MIVCLQVEFAAERIRMELIEAAKSGAAGVAAWGKMDFFCREPRTADPITFTTRDSHLVSICASNFVIIYIMLKKYLYMHTLVAMLIYKKKKQDCVFFFEKECCLLFSFK